MVTLGAATATTLTFLLHGYLFSVFYDFVLISFAPCPSLNLYSYRKRIRFSAEEVAARTRFSSLAFADVNSPLICPLP